MQGCKDKFKLNTVTKLFPALGIAVYSGLFYLATTLYPGGSQANLRSTGYSWLNNYWCELMNQQAMNGQPNPGAVYAVIAMIFAGSAIGVFFYQLPQICKTSTTRARSIKISATLTGLSGVMLFGDFHNPALLCFSIASLFTFFFALTIMLENKRMMFFVVGTICLILTQANNVMYYLRLGVN